MSEQSKSLKYDALVERLDGQDDAESACNSALAAYKELEAELAEAVKRESAQFWRYMAVLDRLAKAEAELKALTPHATREETGELPFIIRYGEQAMGTMYGWPLCTFDAPEPAIKYARDCAKGSPWFYYSVFEKETGKRLFDSRIEPAIHGEEGK